MGSGAKAKKAGNKAFDEWKGQRDKFFIDFLPELDKILIKMYEHPDIGSNAQLSRIMKERGLCLTNGEEYGERLPSILKKSNILRIPLHLAKSFEKVKCCLVQINGN